LSCIVTSAVCAFANEAHSRKINIKAELFLNIFNLLSRNKFLTRDPVNL
jgi:hypothetical protein